MDPNGFRCLLESEGLFKHTQSDSTAIAFFVGIPFYSHSTNLGRSFSKHHRLFCIQLQSTQSASPQDALSF